MTRDKTSGLSGPAPLAQGLAAGPETTTRPHRVPVRAKDVSVRKLHRAECHRPGCNWRGAEHATYQDANAERLAHLNWHILGEG